MNIKDTELEIAETSSLVPLSDDSESSSGDLEALQDDCIAPQPAETPALFEDLSYLMSNDFQ